MLPFTTDQFMSVFAGYNHSIWPIQVLAYLVGSGMVVMLLRPSRAGDRFIGAGLAAMWAWTGIAYHWLHFSTINKAALVFGALFVLQGILLFHASVIRGQLWFGGARGMTSWLGWALVLYSSLIYPLIGMWNGHHYPAMPMFGVAPCPVTLFTFGLLLLSVAPVSRWLMVIPFVWSLIGGSAAVLLSVPQDWPLLFSGVAMVLIVLRDRGRVRVSSGRRGKGDHRLAASSPACDTWHARP
jgi:Family of unknown function (DUF6064)